MYIFRDAYICSYFLCAPDILMVSVQFYFMTGTACVGNETEAIAQAIQVRKIIKL